MCHVLFRYEEEFKDIELKEIMIGDECAKHRAMLETSYPIENGIVKDWEGMRHVYNHTFYELMKIDPKEHKVHMLLVLACLTGMLLGFHVISLSLVSTPSYFILHVSCLMLHAQFPYLMLLVCSFLVHPIL